MNVKLIAILVIAICYLYGLWVNLLEYRSDRNAIPENVRDVYDGEEYERWKQYHHEKVRIGIIGETVVFFAEVLLLGSNAYAALTAWFPENGFASIVAVVLVSLAGDICSLPVDYYDTFFLEQKYGFNRSTKGLFFLDQLKEICIGLVLEVGLAIIVMGLFSWLGGYAVAAFVVVLLIIVLILSLFSTVFLRIFNHFRPLEDGELKTRLTEMLQANGFSVKAIEVMDASARSSKANAAFTGLGKTKTVILYDTLLSSMTTDEICAVFAHEMGHGIHKDTLRQQWLSAFEIIILALCVYCNIQYPAMYQAFGFTEANYAFALLLATGMEMGLIQPLFGLLVNYLSRKAEYLADAFAVSQGYGDAMISALKKLSRENFANLAPSPVTVALCDNHPTISRRIATISEQQRKG